MLAGKGPRSILCDSFPSVPLFIDKKVVQMYDNIIHEYPSGQAHTVLKGGCTMKQTSFIILLVAGLFALLIWLWPERETPVFLPARMPDTVLIIDAGHGGEDGGAVGTNGTIESHINLAVALRLSQLMDLYGAHSVLLRDSDISLHDTSCETLREKKVSDLHNRVSTIENTQNAILISIHQNTFQNPKYHGAQVFFREDEESVALAQTVQEQLKTALDPSNERVPTRIPNSVYLMNHITCPAILVECGFLSNPAEEQLLNSDAYQTKLALTLASAYFTYQEMS